MPRFYTQQDCRRKSDQHWDMAGNARCDGDKAAENSHTDLARVWSQRAAEGGWECESGSAE